jgi:hypothetical protein
VLRAAPVVEDLGFPGDFAGACVERVREIVGAVVENVLAVDCEVTVDRRKRNVVAVVALHGAAVFPQQIARGSVEGLRKIVRVREVHDPVIDQRRAFLHALRERPRPNQAQIVDIAAIDLVERAVPPVIERAAPHEPIGGIRILQHGIGDRHEGLRRLRPNRGAQQRAEQKGASIDV